MFESISLIWFSPYMCVKPQLKLFWFGRNTGLVRMYGKPVWLLFILRILILDINDFTVTIVTKLISDIWKCISDINNLIADIKNRYFY